MSGGGNLELAPQNFRRIEKLTKNVIYSDIIHYFKNKKGFTLAEVLVTLGIIGIVSAMTVPTLMQNYQKKSYVTQLHKVYNELNQALVQYQTDKNAVNLTEAGLNSISSFGNLFKSYFKIVQDCGNERTPCFANSYKKISGVNAGFQCSNNCVVLASGAAIGTYSNIGTYGNNTIIPIVVDTNGAKGPNILGRDAFYILLYKNGVLDDMLATNNGELPPFSKDLHEKSFDGCINSDTSAWHGCFAKILNDNWEMNY